MRLNLFGTVRPPTGGTNGQVDPEPFSVPIVPDMGNFGISGGPVHPGKKVEFFHLGGEFFPGVDAGEVFNIAANGGVRNFKNSSLLTGAALQEINTEKDAKDR